MRTELRHEWRRLFPLWWLCVLLPLPAMLLLHSFAGRSISLGCFFIGCVTLVGFAFRQDTPRAAIPDSRHAKRIWGERMLALVLALFAAWAAFSILILVFNNPPATAEKAIWWRSRFFSEPRDLIAPMLAFMILFPSLCLVPFLTMATRSRFAAAIFTFFLVFSMKLLGAVVVVSVYGWDADKQGLTRMPWNQPDLLVWLFWIFSAALCVVFYCLGAKRFRHIHLSAQGDGAQAHSKKIPAPNDAGI